MLQKGIATTVVGLGIIAALTACGVMSTPSSADSSTGASTKQTQTTAKVDADAGASIKGAPVQAKDNTGTSRMAIVYFSEPEVDDANSVQGATQFIAQTIQDRTGADMFRIRPEEAYPTQHAPLIAKAKVEMTAGARPAVAPIDADWSKYDTIFIGYPIWWGTMPMSVYTFLEQHDFAGKNIVLFSTHGGSGLADTVGTITNIESSAAVNPRAFTVYRDQVTEAAGDVNSWLQSLGY